MEHFEIGRRSLLRAMATVMVGAALPQELLASAALPQETPRPIHIPAKGGKHGKIADGDIAFKMDRSQTSGHLGITESSLPVGYLGAPPHSHQGFDEICRVTQGTLTIMVGQQLFEVRAGDWHLRPRGIVHSFWNTGTETAKFIELYVPGGHEAYMQSLSELFENGKRPQPGALDALAKRYDIQFDWPALRPLMEKYRLKL